MLDDQSVSKRLTPTVAKAQALRNDHEINFSKFYHI